MTRNEDGWIEWHGGENPVPGKVVNLRWLGLAGDDKAEWSSDEQDWPHVGSGHDIIAYRVVTPAPEAPAPSDVAGLTIYLKDGSTETVSVAVNEWIQDWITRHKRDAETEAAAAIERLSRDAAVMREALVWPEREKDLAWLERQKETGHCGESTSEAIQRGRINACIDRLRAALTASQGEGG